MSMLISPTVKTYTKTQPIFFGNRVLHVLFLVSVFLVTSTIRFEIQALEIDWSKRSGTRAITRTPQSEPASAIPKSIAPAWIGEVFETPRPSQEVVLIHTSTGFVPSQIVIDTTRNYELHVVNVSDTVKTASFFIDHFGVQKGMPYASVQKVQLRPKQAGKFSIFSPETNFEAQLIVLDLNKKVSQNP